MDTFTVDVKTTENAVWQGRVRGEDGAQTSFRSTLELLKVLDAALEAGRLSGEAPAGFSAAE